MSPIRIGIRRIRRPHQLFQLVLNRAAVRTRHGGSKLTEHGGSMIPIVRICVLLLTSLSPRRIA